MKKIALFLIILLSVNYLWSQELPTLAVMTLENTSGKAENAWLGIGFSETITSKMARLKNLRVVERRQIEKAVSEINLSQTGMTDPNTAINIGKLLAAQYLLIGSVQKLDLGDKSKLMINLRVIKTETGQIYETVTDRGDYEKIFDIQDNIALRIAAILSLQVSPDDKSAVSNDETTSLAAYEFYYMAKVEPNPAKKIELYQKALKFDPKFVNAMANLASIYMVEQISQSNPDFSLAKEYAQKAVDLNPLNPEIHYVLGTIYRREEKKDEALKELELYLQLDPNSPYKEMVKKSIEKLK